MRGIFKKVGTSSLPVPGTVCVSYVVKVPGVMFPDSITGGAELTLIPAERFGVLAGSRDVGRGPALRAAPGTALRAGPWCLAPRNGTVQGFARSPSGPLTCGGPAC